MRPDSHTSNPGSPPPSGPGHHGMGGPGPVPAAAVLPGDPPDRVTRRARRHVAVLEPELLALVEERQARQGEQQRVHEQRAFAPLRATAVPRHRPTAVVARQHPGQQRVAADRGGRAP